MAIVLLTGPPASGKNTVSAIAASQRERCAIIDVDVIRSMVVRPRSAHGQGEQGARENMRDVHNACVLARTFAEAAYDVLILDILSDVTAAQYRRELAGLAPVILQLLPSLQETLRRNRERPRPTEPSAVAALYQWQAALTAFDVRLDNSGMTPEEAAGRLRSLFDAGKGELS